MACNFTPILLSYDDFIPIQTTILVIIIRLCHWSSDSSQSHDKPMILIFMYTKILKMEKSTNSWNAICIYIGKYLILILKLNNNNNKSDK